MRPAGAFSLIRVQRSCSWSHINLSKGNSTNKTLNELGLILTDVLKDVIPSKRKDDEYINVDDVTEVEIQDGEIKEKAEDIADEVEEELDIEVDDE